MLDDKLLILLSAAPKLVSFVLPAHRSGVRWEQLLDTRDAAGKRRTRATVKGGQSYRLEAHSLAMFRLKTNHDEQANGE